ncbi:hypothetical protein J6590_050677 [Homalodisca vitripennis]|nr:hypothetical protein J6590_050677 [Homalodisca vitripennis]
MSAAMESLVYCRVGASHSRTIVPSSEDKLVTFPSRSTILNGPEERNLETSLACSRNSSIMMMSLRGSAVSLRARRGCVLHYLNVISEDNDLPVCQTQVRDSCRAVCHLFSPQTKHRAADRVARGQSI